MPEKEKITLEYIVKTSQKILYTRLSVPSGLSEWFCDDVNVKDNVYTFSWDGNEESARLVSRKVNEYIKFQWLDDEGTDYYLEFRLSIDPLTNDLALIITDFAESDEKEETTLLWDSQVQDLFRLIGA